MSERGHVLKPLPWKRRVCHWLWCVKCGLVALRNETTQRELRKPCRGDDDAG